MEETSRRVGAILSAEVFKRVKLYHALSGKSLSEIVNEALTEYLASHEAEIRAFLESEWQATEQSSAQ